jgi:polyisoprenoid-binding protein YceI
MKKTLIAATALTVGFASYVTFHPGVAFAAPAYATAQNAKPAATGSYTVDPAHTSVGFEIGHLGVSKVQGRFNKNAGKIEIDEKNLSKSSVEFTIETASIDTAVAPRDAHLRTADFFDAEKYPTIAFKSTAVKKAGKGYVVEGDLTIKATTKKISIPFTAYGPISDPWKNTRVGFVSAPIEINRQDYGVAYNDKLPDGTLSVDNKVTIRLSLEATLNKAAN